MTYWNTEPLLWEEVFIQQVYPVSRRTFKVNFSETFSLPMEIGVEHEYLQPVRETREKQIQLWKELILDYCRTQKIFVVGLDEDFPLFSNPVIERSLSHEAREAFLSALVLEGRAEWLDKSHKKCLILWHRIQDWADLIISFVKDNGLEDGVMTVEEIRSGVESRGTELHGMDRTILMRALKHLEHRGKLALFKGTSADDEGIGILKAGLGFASGVCVCLKIQLIVSLIIENYQPRERREENILHSVGTRSGTVFRDIKDPEHPYSLEELKVISEDAIEVDDRRSYVRVTFTPTVEHCSMATVIGLCLRVKLMRSLPPRYKVDIRVAPGTHATEAAVNKQLNDKERVAAALENPNLVDMVDECLAPSYG
ncbi:UNVERIFIED_CONTAM: Vacuolar protein sorting-associated protein 25 [Sesamum calycinum]|uniref:ESCRT-II complex subunit VPS25 n=1 Tax=Sesamum calycinum TaxID=2727403 RepID=A0AAW2QWZ8_9LAMI